MDYTTKKIYFKEDIVMDFELSNEMKMLADMTYKFAVKEIEPEAQKADEEEKYTPEIRK